jgi:hypothetical protein
MAFVGGRARSVRATMYFRSTSSCCGRSNCCACEAPTCVPHFPWCLLLRVDSATPKTMAVFLYPSSSPPSRASKCSIVLSIAGLVVELWVVKGGSRNAGGVRRCGVWWCAALNGEQRYYRTMLRLKMHTTHIILILPLHVHNTITRALRISSPILLSRVLHSLSDCWDTLYLLGPV